MNKKQIRIAVRDLVKYILPIKEHDKDVIESYTDSFMLACKEYHKSRRKKSCARCGKQTRNHADIGHFCKECNTAIKL